MVEATVDVCDTFAAVGGSKLNLLRTSISLSRDALQIVCLGPWSCLKLPKVTFVLGVFPKEGEFFTFLACYFRTVNT